MQKNITQFLRNNHILSLATCDEEVYAASCFYCFDEESIALLFASDPHTHHMRQIARNPKVAGTIHVCERSVHKIQGVQFRGVVKEATKKQRERYLHAFPFAAVLQPVVWAIALEWVKMTDNTLGFKTKTIWTR